MLLYFFLEQCSLVETWW